ncbi:MAG: protein kinase, partial [Myxococcota bacterium]
RLVHRDINPANVFLSYDGHVKLGDFGVASLAADQVEKSRELAGKIGYFAPEQLAGDAVDQRSDLFSMGVMMFEIFTGQRLFDGSDQNKIMRLNKKAKIPKPSKLNPSIPPGLEAVILRALERNPKDRYQSARQMREALMPFAPDPSGMPLAVASLMRMVFLQEHIQELQLREGLNGSAAVRGSGQQVALYSTDERARVAFSELLNSRGYRVLPFIDIATFKLACSQRVVPDVVLVGVADAALVAEELSSVLRGFSRPVPVIGVCDNLDASVCAIAHQLGAVDLLSKPFNIERVLTSVRAALSGAARVIEKPAARTQESPTARTKILVVSSDPGLVARMSTGLTECAILTDVASVPAEALARTLETSYDGVVFDAPGGAQPAHLFMNQFRSQPGMGLVPVVYLTDPGLHGEFGDLEQDRSFVASRTEYPKRISEELNRLLADTRMGRSFIRYDTAFPVELRFGGRVFAGDAINVSRGGLMLRCEQLPPIGESVSVSLRFPGEPRALEVNGSVIRVDMARQEGEQPRIGVSFERFTGRGEASLIGFLQRLDQDANQRQTVI